MYSHLFPYTGEGTFTGRGVGGPVSSMLFL